MTEGSSRDYYGTPPMGSTHKVLPTTHMNDPYITGKDTVGELQPYGSWHGDAVQGDLDDERSYYSNTQPHNLVSTNEIHGGVVNGHNTSTNNHNYNTDAYPDSYDDKVPAYGGAPYEGIDNKYKQQQGPGALQITNQKSEMDPNQIPYFDIEYQQNNQQYVPVYDSQYQEMDAGGNSKPDHVNVDLRQNNIPFHPPQGPIPIQQLQHHHQHLQHHHVHHHNPHHQQQHIPQHQPQQPPQHQPHQPPQHAPQFHPPQHQQQAPPPPQLQPHPQSQYDALPFQPNLENPNYNGPSGSDNEQIRNSSLRYDDLFGLGVGEAFSNHPQPQMPPPPTQLQKLPDIRDFSVANAKAPTPSSTSAPKSQPAKRTNRRKKPTHMHLSFDDLLSQPAMNVVSMPQTADGFPGMAQHSSLSFENEFFPLNDDITPFMVPPLVENSNGYFPTLQSPSMFGNQTTEISSYFHVPTNTEFKDQEQTGAVLREKFVSGKRNSSGQGYNPYSQPQFWSEHDNQVPMKRKHPDSPDDYKFVLVDEDNIQGELPRHQGHRGLHHRRVQSTGKLTEKHNERVHKDSAIMLGKNPIDDCISNPGQRKSNGQYDQGQLLPGEKLLEGDLGNEFEFQTKHAEVIGSNESIGMKNSSQDISGGKKRTSKGLTCSICNKFIKRDYTRHMRIHDKVGRFQCVYPKSMCLHKTQNFNRPYDYKKHLLHIHFVFENHWGKTTKLLTDKLPLAGSCVACGERFLASDWLENHVLTDDASKRCKHIDAPNRANMASLMSESEELDELDYDDDESGS